MNERKEGRKKEREKERKRERKKETFKSGSGDNTFNPSTWEAGAGRFLSLRQAWSEGEFQDSQGYTEKPCLKKQTNKQTHKQEGRKKSKSLVAGWRIDW